MIPFTTTRTWCSGKDTCCSQEWNMSHQSVTGLFFPLKRALSEQPAYHRLFTNNLAIFAACGTRHILQRNRFAKEMVHYHNADCVSIESPHPVLSIRGPLLSWINRRITPESRVQTALPASHRHTLQCPREKMGEHLNGNIPRQLKSQVSFNIKKIQKVLEVLEMNEEFPLKLGSDSEF